MFFNKNFEKWTPTKDAARAWRPLRFELASKTGSKEVWEGSHFRGRTLADSLQTSCTLASRVGSKPAGFAAPVSAVLCTRRLHNCRRRAGEKYWKAIGFLKVLFIATCKFVIFFSISIVVINPLRSLFLLHILSLSLHSDTHLSRRTAQSVLSPSAWCTCCPHDLIVIEYGKWMTSICNQHCLKVVDLTRNKVAISLRILTLLHKILYLNHCKSRLFVFIALMDFN